MIILWQYYACIIFSFDFREEGLDKREFIVLSYILRRDHKTIKKGFTAFDEVKALKKIEHLQDSKILVICQVPWFLWLKLPNDHIYLCTVSNKKQASSLINQGESLQ